MKKSLTDDLWKMRFDEFGNAPRVWADTASSLKTSAEVLQTFYVPLREYVSYSIRPTQSTKSAYQRSEVYPVIGMLLAMATECLLKALWLKYGGKLAEKGEFTSIQGVKNHALDQMAKAVSQKGIIQFPKTELDLLERASWLIERGRYPIPKNYLNHHFRPKGFRGDHLVELRAIMDKLENELAV